jgi:hypothetical protein
LAGTVYSVLFNDAEASEGYYTREGNSFTFSKQGLFKVVLQHSDITSNVLEPVKVVYPIDVLSLKVNITVTVGSGISAGAAKVTAYNWDDMEVAGEGVWTAGQGYIISGVRSGKYRILATADGYYPTWSITAVSWREAAPVNVNAEDPVTWLIPIEPVRLNTVLDGTITFEGTVHDDAINRSSIKAKVARNAVIIVWKKKSKKSIDPDEWELYFTAQADDDGHFNIKNLPSGEYLVVCEMPGFELEGDGILVEAQDNNTYSNLDFYISTEDGKIVMEHNIVVTPTGVEERHVLPLLIYPNPVNSGQEITLELPTDAKPVGEYSIRIYSLSGQEVKHIRATGLKTVISLNLPAGIYIIKINEYVEKIIFL